MDKTLCARFALAPLFLACSFGASAQSNTVDVALVIDGRKFAASGPGDCKSSAQASIYGVAASQDSVAFLGDGKSLNLTLWRPRTGAAMMNLRVSGDGKRVNLDTVRGGTKKDAPKGSGTATLARSGEGGTITIDAVGEKGEKIAGTIRCARFGGIRAEGG